MLSLYFNFLFKVHFSGLLIQRVLDISNGAIIPLANNISLVNSMNCCRQMERKRNLSTNLLRCSFCSLVFPFNLSFTCLDFKISRFVFFSIFLTIVSAVGPVVSFYVLNLHFNRELAVVLQIIISTFSVLLSIYLFKNIFPEEMFEKKNI
jgi:hypothetical protein